MSAGSDTGPWSPQHCPSCGMPVGVGAAFCGSCGRALATAPESANAASAQLVPQSAALPADATTPMMQTWPGASRPTAVGEWSATIPAVPTGMAALAATPVARPPTRHRKRGLIAGIAALCLVAVLSAGAYWVFAAFLSPGNQVTSARYLPDTTVFYASVDLVAAAATSHQLAAGQIAKQTGGTDTLQAATGLNWQTDVAPWVGRLVTFAVIPGQVGGTGGTGGIGSLPVGAVVLLQSRDDGAAQRTVDKALAFQEQKGATFTQSSYGGYTLHTGGGSGSPSGTVATGSGLVIFGSTVDAAHSVIDRANGHGNTLAGSSDFQKAIGDLPANRFGTMYLGLRAVTDPLSAGGSTVNLPFVGTYPTAAGALLWTSTGLRWQVTFKPARSGVPQDALSGDTTSLASMVPSNAVAYVGAANAGLLISDFSALVNPTGQSTAQADPLQAQLGVATTDPAVREPAAFFVLPGASAASSPASTSGGLLLRAPDAAAAHALLTSVAAHNQWTSKATTVDGVAATAYYGNSASPGMRTGLIPTAGGLATTGPTMVGNVITPASTSPVAVAATVHGTLVMASSTSALTDIIETANGNHANLTQSGTFHQLVAAAPAGGALTAFVDMSSMPRMLSPFLSSATLDPTSQASAALFTLVWNDAQLQATYDLSMSH